MLTISPRLMMTIKIMNGDDECDDYSDGNDAHDSNGDDDSD
jgi:hypothetical protein